MRASSEYSSDLQDLGRQLLEALSSPVIERNEYLQIVLLNLFARVPDLDHVNRLTAMYGSRPPSVQREIVFVAGVMDQGHWIKERKDEFGTSDQWLRRALISAAPSLPGDEAKYWINRIKRDISGIEKIVARWAFRDKALKVGDISIP